MAGGLARWAAAIGAALWLIGTANAADWPTKPVHVIVAYAAGGANDLLGRVFAEQLTQALGQPFLVENRTGGGGLVGTEYVARSQPDGYTLIVSGMPSHVLAPAMNKNAGFDPVRDFTHIAYLGGPPNVFAVHNSSPAKSFSELLDLMRKQPGGVEYVSPSVGSVGNMVAEYVAAKEHVKLTHVAYRGGGSAIFDLVAGHVKMGSMTLSTMSQHIKAGTLRPLAVTTIKRTSLMPELATVAELGLPGFDATTWHGLVAPAGTPKDVVETLHAATVKALQDPDTRRALADLGVEIAGSSPQEFAAYIASEIPKWTAVVKASGAQLD